MSEGQALLASTDPMERIVEAALVYAGIPFASEPHTAHRLDFHLPGPNVAIEVKQLHSERIAAQMARHPDVIAVQGRRAVEWFANLIRENEIMRRELVETTAALVKARAILPTDKGTSR